MSLQVPNQGSDPSRTVFSIHEYGKARDMINHQTLYMKGGYGFSTSKGMDMENLWLDFGQPDFYLDYGGDGKQWANGNEASQHASFTLELPIVAGRVSDIRGDAEKLPPKWSVRFRGLPKHGTAARPQPFIETRPEGEERAALERAVGQDAMHLYFDAWDPRDVNGRELVPTQRIFFHLDIDPDKFVVEALPPDDERFRKAPCDIEDLLRKHFAGEARLAQPKLQRIVVSVPDKVRADGTCLNCGEDHGEGGH